MSSEHNPLRPRHSPRRWPKFNRVVVVLSGLFSTVSLLIALFSVYLTRDSVSIAGQAVATQEKQARAELFAAFQEQYRGMASEFPDRIHEADYRAKRGSKDWHTMKRYWILCFSEWYATTQLHPELFDVLWRQFYRTVISDAVNIPALRAVLVDLAEYDWREHPVMTTFLRELEDISRGTKEPLELVK